MSTDLSVYIPSTNNKVIAQIQRRLAEYGLECEFAPGTALFDEDGFLPIHLKVVSEDAPESVRNKSVITGFECSTEDFDYHSELQLLKKGQKAGFFQKLLGLADDRRGDASKKHIASEEIDVVLKNCHKTFDINSHSLSESLISNCFAAVLAEQASGVVYDPQSGEYMLPTDALARIANDVRSCEALAEAEPFTGWS
jgi:hypothetical protein